MLGDDALGLLDGGLGQLILRLVSRQPGELVLADVAAGLGNLRLRDTPTELVLFSMSLLVFDLHDVVLIL